MYILSIQLSPNRFKHSKSIDGSMFPMFQSTEKTKLTSGKAFLMPVATLRIRLIFRSRNSFKSTTESWDPNQRKGIISAGIGSGAPSTKNPSVPFTASTTKFPLEFSSFFSFFHQILDHFRVLREKSIKNRWKWMDLKGKTNFSSVFSTKTWPEAFLTVVPLGFFFNWTPFCNDSNSDMPYSTVIFLFSESLSLVPWWLLCLNRRTKCYVIKNKKDASTHF